jgi:signal transduction histidine kinase
MRPLSRVPNNYQSNQNQASQALIAELEASLTQLTRQLLTTKASLEREIADRLSKEEEFRRSTEQWMLMERRRSSASLQEILTNVTRHAQATRIEVSVEENHTFLTLQVQDNGRGITASEIHSPKSIGLLGMQERARLRAGEVHFQGASGQGTTVTVRLPLSTTR